MDATENVTARHEDPVYVSHLIKALLRINNYKNKKFGATIAQQVYEQLISQLFEGVLQPGNHLVELKLAQSLGVSTIPIREALIRMDQEGWVERRQSHSTTVCDFREPQKCRQLYALRLSLEEGAFYHLADCVTDEQLTRIEDILTEIEASVAKKDMLSYRIADAQLHLTVAEFAGGARLREMFRPVLLQIFVMANPGNPPDIREQQGVSHRMLVEAIRGHQATQAAEFIKKHIMRQVYFHGFEI